MNVASRVEGLTKTVGHGLVITSSTRAEIGDAFRLIELPAQSVKGKSEPLELFAVDGSIASLSPTDREAASD